MWPVTTTANSNSYGHYFWYKVASGESGNYTVTHATGVNRGSIVRVTVNTTSSPFSLTRR